MCKCPLSGKVSIDRANNLSDSLHCFSRYAKMWQEGITFTCTDCTHIFLVDLYGTRTTTDTFTNASCDYTLPVFLK